MNVVTKRLLEEALLQVAAKPSLLKEGVIYFDEVDLRIFFKEVAVGLQEYDLSVMVISETPKKIEFALQQRDFELNGGRSGITDVTPKSSANARQYTLFVEGDRLVLVNRKKWRVSLNSGNKQCVLYALESILEGHF